MLQTINLKQLNGEETRHLFKFFENQATLGKKYWKKNKTYHFEDGTAFQFKNDVFRSVDKHVRYRVISNKKEIGQGGMGTIRLLKGTLALNEKAFFKKTNKKNERLIVKIQQHNDKNTLDNLNQEYNFSKKAGHLAIKKPTIISKSTKDSRSYTVMKKLPGRELYDILNDDILTTKQRIELSKALLQALKKQASDKGIVHRDIKPENILVDFGPPLDRQHYGLRVKS